MGRSRKTGVPSEPATEETDGQKPAANETPAESKLTLAEAKLERMQETNKLCFRHQNDFAKIQQELKERFKYSESEMEHILEPKGQRLIPGFGYAEMERQKQYVAFLKKNADQRGSLADRVQQSREVDQEPAL